MSSVRLATGGPTGTGAASITVGRASSLVTVATGGVGAGACSRAPRHPPEQPTRDASTIEYGRSEGMVGP